MPAKEPSTNASRLARYAAALEEAEKALVAASAPLAALADLMQLEGPDEWPLRAKVLQHMMSTAALSVALSGCDPREINRGRN